MKKIIILSFAVLSFGMANMANASDLKKMVGKWKWKEFTVEVINCKETEVCATVTAGPKNVGLKMIRSKLNPKGKAFFGKIAHPQTGDIYNTNIQMSDANTWKLDGCTDKNVCATGEFKRIK